MKKQKELKGKKQKKQKRPKEVYVPKKGLTGQGNDYHVYAMNSKEKAMAFLLGFGIAFAVIWLFFKILLLAFIVGVGTGIFIQKYYCSHLCERRKKTLLMQFRDMLESLTSSYSSGKNTNGAFADAYGDMIQIYGERADIVQELKIILTGINSNINIEVLLADFADRSELTDIKSFADVFDVSVKQGGNIKDIIAATRDIINDKIEIELEIGTLLSGNKNELNIMMIMPLIIIVSMEGMGSEMTVTGNSLLNVLIKILALGMFAAAYVLGKKITTIKI
ncbi:MAG TPA: kinase [Candidatus Eisenbergiella pullicola]|nr:kinase [Candidatus Eisenbergiella pullicola]